MSMLRLRVMVAPALIRRRTTSATSGEPATPAPGFSMRKKRRRMLARARANGLTAGYSTNAARSRTSAGGHLARALPCGRAIPAAEVCWGLADRRLRGPGFFLLRLVGRACHKAVMRIRFCRHHDRRAGP